ncbi:MAG: C40 family peptidase [Armatimonadetes bacterium]|nr:C40 family peptidase [Armatimonadota bacterium]
MRTLALWACLLLVSASFGEEYKIKQGDTVERIAKKLGVPASKIRGANPRMNERRLRPGQTLSIPSEKKSSKTSTKKTSNSSSKSTKGNYTIKPGDNDWTLAKRYGITVSELKKLNGGRNMANLRDGEKIVVPSNSKSTKTVAKTKSATTSKTVAKAPTKAPTPPKAVAVKANKIDGTYARVIKDDVILRKLPRTDSDKVNLVDSGTVGRIIDRRREWYELRLSNGKRGWVRGDMVAEAKDAEVVAFVKRASGSTNQPSEVKPAKKEAKEEPQVKQPIASENNSSASKVISTAKSLMGTRYVWGGTSRGGFDCSGFVGYVMRKVGISLPRTSIEQSRVGTYVSRGSLRAGDLVFFITRGSRVSHVGIYIGGNQFIHASSGGGQVRINSLSGYYSSHYATARRVGKFQDVKSAVEEIQRELEDSGELPTPDVDPGVKVTQGADEVSK